MKKPNVWSFVMTIVFVIFALTMSTLHERLSHVDGKLMSAKYVEFPGQIEVGYPENTVDLSDWAGTNIADLKITVNNAESAELEAAATLKALGVYGDEYQLKKVNEHWVLYRPEKYWKEFSMTAYYRISKLVPYEG